MFRSLPVINRLAHLQQSITTTVNSDSASISIASVLKRNRGTVAVALLSVLTGCTGTIGDPYGETFGDEKHNCFHYPDFTADHPFYQKVDGFLPHPNSDTWINFIGEKSLWPDMGYPEYWPSPEEGWGIPVTMIDGEKRVPVTITKWVNEGQNAENYWPIPAYAAKEGGVDGHVLVVDKETCTLYEMYQSVMLKDAKGNFSGWEATSAVAFDLTSPKSLSPGWTSADAAGLPIYPGLLTCEDVMYGVTHAIRFTVSKTGDGYVANFASHCAPSVNLDELRFAPPMGALLVMKKDYCEEINNLLLHPQAQNIIKGLCDYGLVLADNGGDWYMSGVKDSQCFDSEALDQIKKIKVNLDHFYFADTGEITYGACF